MKVLLIVTLCALGALADLDYLIGSNEDDKPRPSMIAHWRVKRDVARELLNMKREMFVRLRRQAGELNPNVSRIYISGPHNITAEDFPDDCWQTEKEGESTHRTKGHLMCNEDSQREAPYPHMLVIQSLMMARYDYLKDTIDHKKNILLKIMRNRKNRMTRGE